MSPPLDGSPTRRRRAGAISVVIGCALGLLLAALPAVPAAACACGGVAPSPGSQVAVNEEHAIVSRAGGVEQIDLLLGMLSTDTQTGLIFPTPTPATVTLGDRADFEALDRVTTPTRVEDYDPWTTRGDGYGAPAGGAPQVLADVDLGPIRAVTLAADDAGALSTWLADNNFVLPDAVSALLGSYVERGWYFVAMKLTGEAPLEGDLDPIRFTFDSDTLVYPLELSRAATDPQTVRLYVVDDHRQVVAFDDHHPVDTASVTWAAPVTGTEVGHFGDFLTVFDLFFPDPGSQITGDLTFTDDTTDATFGTEVHVSVPLGIFGIPLGWLLIALGGILVLAVLLVVGMVNTKHS
ncbi:MAG: DUF2330 domain-containing protein [Pseudolysinimonas sp.]|uniref:DUF2330 domain-containing protein n=1 Tax=Pseudolysinimonas sp. TaxID=2680009 RepID=UPI00326703F7